MRVAIGKRRPTGKTSKQNTTLSEPLRQLLEEAPVALAVTRDTTHTLIYANAAFRALPGAVHAATRGRSIGDLFDATVKTRLTALLDRALREGSALRDQFLGPLEADGAPWSCTVWPVSREAQLPQGLVIQLSLTTPLGATLALQREVAERLLLSALRESDAARGAEASQQRAELLATAGRHLAESLETEKTQEAVAGLTAPSLAEWCIVDLLEVDGTMHRLNIIHRDPGKQALVSQLNDWSPQRGDPFGIPAVLDSAEPLLITDDVEEVLRTAAHNADNLRVLHELGIGSVLTVPLKGENRQLGAISFVRGKREPAFADQEIELAKSLASHSALALEKARLYGEAIMLKNNAEAVAKAATTFLGTISHELRTPLNAIFGYAELIAEGVHGPVTDAQRQALERIISSQQRLIILIRELLSFMRVGSGRATYEVVDVSIEDAATHTVDLLQPLIAKQGLTCRIVAEAPGIIASADPVRVDQILVNLISNAIKFTPPGGEITIVCKATQDSAVISVIDNGRGIPPDKLDLIFEPFVQAHEDDAKEHGGIGLGLPISRDLARAMGGNLTVESTQGKGATFTLTLPSRALIGKTEPEKD